MWQTTYTRVHISVEHHRTSRKVMSKPGHVTDTTELDRREEAVHR